MEKSIAAETLAPCENFSERDSRIDRMRGETATLALDAANRRLNRFIRNFRREQAQTQEKYGQLITELQREADQINNEVEALESQRNQLLAQMDTRVRDPAY